VANRDDSFRSAPPPFDLGGCEASFPAGAWAAGEDYVIAERVRDLRRDGRTLAGRVIGRQGDYWVRVELAQPPASACTCGRPRCRHAAALLQALRAGRQPVTDVGRLLEDFLAHPRRGPLAAAALGEDFVAALSLPAETAQDLLAVPDEQRLVALDAALGAAPDPAPLALWAFAQPDPAYADVAAHALHERPPSPAVWPDLLRSAPKALAAAVAELRPAALTGPAALAALWRAAADGDAEGLERLAPHAVDLAPESAYHALGDLLGAHPRLLRDYLAAARASGELRRAAGALVRRTDGLPPDEAARALRAIREAAELPPRLKAALDLRLASAAGSSAAMRSARRAALRAGAWPRLRGAVLRRLRQRPDGPALETELWLLDGDLTAAAEAAARCTTSPLPERLLARALRASDPAGARAHALRARAIAERLAATAEGGRLRPGPARKPTSRR